MSLWEKKLVDWQRRIKPGDVVKSTANENYLVTDILHWEEEIWVSVYCSRGIIVKPSASLLPLDNSEVWVKNAD